MMTWSHTKHLQNVTQRHIRKNLRSKNTQSYGGHEKILQSNLQNGDSCCHSRRHRRNLMEN
nr:MAG TPA: hypothetical protein [Caudoviricetes sp.]